MDKKYKYKLNFRPSILFTAALGVIIIAGSYYKHWQLFLILPVVWIIPIFFTLSRSVRVTDDFIEKFYLWILPFRAVRFSQIQEFSKCRPALSNPPETQISNLLIKKSTSTFLKIIIKETSLFFLSTFLINEKSALLLFSNPSLSESLIYKYTFCFYSAYSSADRKCLVVRNL